MHLWLLLHIQLVAVQCVLGTDYIQLPQCPVLIDKARVPGGAEGDKCECWGWPGRFE